MKYYAYNLDIYDDWIQYLVNCNIIFITNSDMIDEEYKIIPIMPSHYKIITDKFLFNNNYSVIDTFDNKGLFTLFMIKYFSKNIVPTYYLNINGETIIYKETTEDMIIRNNYGSGGQHTYKINKILKADNILISKYIYHDTNYVGHFLVNKGIIIKKCYFYAENNFIIKMGKIVDYNIKYDIDIKYEDIIEQIFLKLEYSGFACIDFTIYDNNIILFEINPRLGGSLVSNTDVFITFIEKLALFL